MCALQTMTVPPAGDHRKKSLIFGGNPSAQNFVLEKQQRHKNAACNACIANDDSSPCRGSPQVIPFSINNFKQVPQALE
jgi:hypothetical protein